MLQNKVDVEPCLGDSNEAENHVDEVGNTNHDRTGISFRRPEMGERERREERRGQGRGEADRVLSVKDIEVKQSRREGRGFHTSVHPGGFRDRD